MIDAEKLKILGRKVFFINPSIQIERSIVQELRNLEYETYVIRDYKCAKSVLRENSDAICFIYIDFGLTYTQWYKFIRTFDFDELLEDIFIGIFSDRIPGFKKDFFLMNTTLPGGFTMTNIPPNTLFSKVQKILDVNEVKGQRKYIRLSLHKNKQITCHIFIAGRLFPLELLDISSVGFAVKMTSALATVFAPNKILNNISLTINNKPYAITASVLMSKVAGDTMNSVLVIKGASEEITKIIRKFIFSVLDEQLNATMAAHEKDETNYEALDLEEFESYGSISDADDTAESAENLSEVEELQ